MRINERQRPVSNLLHRARARLGVQSFNRRAFLSCVTFIMLSIRGLCGVKCRAIGDLTILDAEGEFRSLHARWCGGVITKALECAFGRTQPDLAFLRLERRPSAFPRPSSRRDPRRVIMPPGTLLELFPFSFYDLYYEALSSPGAVSGRRGHRAAVPRGRSSAMPRFATRPRGFTSHRTR